ncbi:MAG: ABC transporter permease, partial [Ruminiclostridium sp.]|nr:ABC transporter permease [Ruminiclostridium sp.]
EKRETEKHFADSDMSLLDAIKEHTDESFAVFVNTRIQVMDSAVGLGAAATLIGLYIGIVFLISCGAILSIKALSENIDSLSSYDVLRKIGADEKDINRSLFRQTGVFFLLPLLLACIHSIFGIKFAATVFEAFGTTGLLPAMLATAVIVIVIYGGYFLITYYCGKGIIRTK